jgi:hypothetical protein
MQKYDSPQIIIKMYQQNPHRVCASVRISPEGIAVGYFIDEHIHPSFVLRNVDNLYNLISANVVRLRRADPDQPYQENNWLVFIVGSGSNSTASAFYKILFSEAFNYHDISEPLLQLFDAGREHSKKHPPI